MPIVSDTCKGVTKFVTLVTLAALAAACSERQSTEPTSGLRPQAAALSISPTLWTAGGPGTVTLLNDGSTGNPSMSYALSGSAVFNTQTWSFSTAATADGSITQNYDYSGFHAFFEVRAFVHPFVIHNSAKTYLTGVNLGPANCCSSPSNGFHITGSTTFNVSAGDRYGWEIGGSNFDSDSRLQGTFTVVIPDNTPPTITPTITGTLGANGWYTSDVKVSWTVNDPESTPTTCESTTITSNTAGQTVTCDASSAGGPASNSVTIKVDKTIPTVTGAVTSGTLGANGWYTSPVGIVWTISDAGPSGQTQSSDCSTTSLSTSNASFTFTCTVTTGAGLKSSQASVPVKLDTSAPTIAVAVTGTLGNNGWYTSDVGVSFTPADPTSGVASTSGCTSASVTTDNAGVTYTCSATNGAGLSSMKPVTIKRDATKPVIGYSGNAGSYTVDQTVAITCSASDAMSQLASTTCANVNGAAYTFTIGTNSYSASAVDNAGNTNGASTSFTVSVTNGSLCALVTRWVTNAGVANSLCVKLSANAYAAFRNELSAQGGKKFVSDANAAELLTLVNVLDPQ